MVGLRWLPVCGQIRNALNHTRSRGSPYTYARNMATRVYVMWVMPITGFVGHQVATLAGRAVRRARAEILARDDAVFESTGSGPRTESALVVAVSFGAEHRQAVMANAVALRKRLSFSS